MPEVKKSIRIVLLMIGHLSPAQNIISPPAQDSWLKDEEPFRIAGNLYAVGTYDLACYLITTPQGNILINI